MMRYRAYAIMKGNVHRWDVAEVSVSTHTTYTFDSTHPTVMLSMDYRSAWP